MYTKDKNKLIDGVVLFTHMAALKCDPEEWRQGRPIKIDVNVPDKFMRFLEAVATDLSIDVTDLLRTYINDRVIDGLTLLAKTYDEKIAKYKWEKYVEKTKN